MNNCKGIIIYLLMKQLISFRFISTYLGIYYYSFIILSSSLLNYNFILYFYKLLKLSILCLEKKLFN
ncbi:hypothetical protein H8356DRAFT_948953 [Neocallimastix lanati (nom. inval.)]|uniref:Uncharacterized protein n=1 Tax=Neocallimastix californiae TaxID=1754190 RepID=A0A1Y2BUN6_9FUNG|nr:hypothetical protein H8356DRAFT_970904 [Neocallimastix sp. JGI-2020a]ORY38469.1 hypothetical protein LY90DRAFT_47914 [Neocallimastix californiae]KAG4082347.1 hypothetical protein H8356DRAFT_1284478 [Neocallimastix sp. JGI-2020a]KAG4082645.1 hypothetical protein H8356DRAFT_1385003 [Neocallimastix sp. JGI-2020a]KAG4083274.1 hypothetical protein H8356DRAFT_1382024 [Neocallimastix sp. JGI-2020a]|eukprot:ORY38469.1 hypothetical protein LY90DRAFT_47914 [Neocallimastix californiae]